MINNIDSIICGDNVEIMRQLPDAGGIMSLMCNSDPCNHLISRLDEDTMRYTREPYCLNCGKTQDVIDNEIESLDAIVDRINALTEKIRARNWHEKGVDTIL